VVAEKLETLRAKDLRWDIFENSWGVQSLKVTHLPTEKVAYGERRPGESALALRDRVFDDLCANRLSG
jgi:hypothetical protein